MNDAKIEELLQAILDSNLRLEAAGKARDEKIDASIAALMPMITKAFENLHISITTQEIPIP